MTDASDRIPYDVHGRLDDPVNALALALGHWEGRDDSRAEPHVRRAASEAVDVIDEMTAVLFRWRERLVREIRVSDDAAMARSEMLLADLRREAGLRDDAPVADVAAFCRGCRRGTVSVPCERCGGPACAICRRCPDCDGEAGGVSGEPGGGREFPR